MRIPYCGALCGEPAQNIDESCRELSFAPGYRVIFKSPDDPGGRCYCACSCLAADTPVATPHGAVKVQHVVPDETSVLAAGRDLRFKPVRVTQASTVPAGVTEHTVYVHYLVEGSPREMVVTRDHAFLLHGGTLILADTLRVGDALTDQAGNPAPVVEVGWGSYTGAFHAFATVMEPPPADLDGHLVLTNGIVSGDFAVQVFSRIERPVGRSAVDPRPSVGSDAWLEARGDAPARADGERALGAGTFSPASLREVRVPAHAADFLPQAQAERLRKVGKKRPKDDTYYKQMVEFILGTLRSLYPDLAFRSDWDSDDVNAHSWIEDGEPHVLVNGGLPRMKALEQEGLYLAVAHEVGHLVAPAGDAPDGMACEGEADYYGAKIVLRKVWFGESYLDNMEKAVAQVTALFDELGKDGGESGGEDGYPPIPCRLETFAAAMGLAHKPACADCP